MSVSLSDEQTDHEVDTGALLGLVVMVLEVTGHQEADVALLVIDEQSMTDLNRQYMDENQPTDVLAFPIDGPQAPVSPSDSPAGSGPPGHAGAPPGGANPASLLDADDLEDESDDMPWLLGDVVLCPAYAARQAANAGQTLAAELELLTVHGILHLLGMDHAEPEEEKEMRARTDELLARWRSRPASGGAPDA